MIEFKLWRVVGRVTVLKHGAEAGRRRETNVRIVIVCADSFQGAYDHAAAALLWGYPNATVSLLSISPMQNQATNAQIEVCVPPALISREELP